MKTGIIFEIYEAHLTLLTPDGQFMHANNHHNQYQLGQEIDFFPLDIEAKKTISALSWLSVLKGKRLATVVLAVLLLTASLIPVYQSNQVYAYMSIDNQSSIELAVNKELEVIKLTPYNKKGEEIIKEIDKWQKQDMTTVSGKILNEMKKQGIDNSNVVVSTVLKGDRNTKAERKLNLEMNELLIEAHNTQTELTVVKGTKSEREKANKHGKTLGEFKQKKVKTKKGNSKENTKQPIDQNQKEQKTTKPDKNSKGMVNPTIPNTQQQDKQKPNQSNGETSKSEEQQNQNRKDTQNLSKKDKSQSNKFVSPQNKGKEKVRE